MLGRGISQDLRLDENCQHASPRYELEAFEYYTTTLL